MNRYMVCSVPTSWGGAGFLKAWVGRAVVESSGSRGQPAILMGVCRDVPWLLWKLKVYMAACIVTSCWSMYVCVASDAQ